MSHLNIEFNIEHIVILLIAVSCHTMNHLDEIISAHC